MHRHTEQTIYDKMSVAPLCTIQTKHIITGQDSTITTEWCATFMVINVLFYVFVLWICAFDQHTSVSAQVYTRGTQSSLNQWQSHTLSSPLSAFHSLKTDVHADRPFIHQQDEEEDAVLPLPPCLHLSTQPKQKHLDKPNNVSCVWLTTPSSSQGQGSVQHSHRRASALGHYSTKGWEWLLPKHMLLLHTTGYGICCSSLS